MTRTLNAAVLALILAGCASQPVDDPLDTRETLLKAANNQPGLVAHYKANLQSKPQYKLALINVYLDQGDIRSAELYTSLLTETEMTQPPVKLALARIQCQQQHWLECQQALDGYRQAGGDTVQYLLQQGRASAGQGRHEEAIAQFEEARRLGADDLLVKNNQAVVRMMQKRYADALQLLYPLYLVNPADKGIQANLILAAIQADRPEVALDVLRRQYDEAQARRRLEALVGGIRPKQQDEVLWMEEQALSDAKARLGREPQTESGFAPEPKPVAGPAAQSRPEMDKSQPAGNPPSTAPAVAAPPAGQPGQCVVTPAEEKRFCVQVTSWERPLSRRLRQDFNERYGSLFEHLSGGRYRYCVGEFDSLAGARAFLTEVSEAGAYVVFKTNCHKRVAP
ncbi:hypothetical protein FCL40_09810 [Ferrimonas sediminicola]|uniref:Uncharacterized protein n=1 Tax=Ferrimonas sediminicola TaxID=2569538 RepID=A0A4U1BD96_9GAMM|nr:hypothetical protein [Ferrimonas sediminicola]TKB48926.1 hypothetical protein FCL40_09810 [Ferrimonas sediminicola]